MIVRLVLTGEEATPDRDLLARLALRHRMRAVPCSEPVTLATPCVASHRTLAGSGNCLEIPDSSRSGRLAPQLQLDLTLGGATG